MADPRVSAATRPVFYFDVGSPWCWLTAERVGEVVGARCEWQPIVLPPADVDRAAVEAAAAERGYPMRWPERWPTDTRLAMLAATFAKQTGRVVAYSLAAMRQAYLAGRDLAVEDNVLISAAACELHPRAVLTGVASRGVRAALDAAGEAAAAAGVECVPAFALSGRVLDGPVALDSVAAALCN